MKRTYRFIINEPTIDYLPAGTNCYRCGAMYARYVDAVAIVKTWDYDPANHVLGWSDEIPCCWLCKLVKDSYNELQFERYNCAEDNRARRAARLLINDAHLETDMLRYVC